MYKIEYEDFERRCKIIAKEIKKHKDIKNIFGIPYSGLFVAIRISKMTGIPMTPNPSTKSTVIIDDVLDSGATFQIYKKFKYFYVLIDKQKEGITEWVDTCWERK